MRLVSLCPSITETLIDFGLAENLVGITRFCIHPEAVVRTLPKVGGTKDPNIEAIRAANPDLIFVNEEENRKEDYEQLRSEFKVDVSYPRRVDEVPDVLRRIGALTGTQDSAKARAAELEAALEKLEAARKMRPDHRFTFAYMIWKKPWMTISDDTYISDLLERAGGMNAFAGHQDRYPTTSLEELREKAPQLLLLSDEPFPFSEAHRDEVQTELSPSTRVALVSGDDCCWHGVRSLRGVALAHRLLLR